MGQRRLTFGEEVDAFGDSVTTKKKFRELRMHIDQRVGNEVVSGKSEANRNKSGPIGETSPEGGTPDDTMDKADGKNREEQEEDLNGCETIGGAIPVEIQDYGIPMGVDRWWRSARRDQTKGEIATK